MKTRTKLLAVVLTLTMLVSVFAAFPVNAAVSAVFLVDADNVKQGGTAGTYDFTNAVAQVKDGGTIKMTGNCNWGDRVVLSSAKTFTLDGSNGAGGNYTIYDQRSSQDILKLEGGQCNMTVTHVTFAIGESTGNDSVLFLGDNSNDTLTLGEGVLFTGNTVGAGAVMLAKGTLNISGAEFEVNGAAIALWGNKTRTLNLNSGALSRSETIAAIHHGYGSIGTNNTINVNALLQVNDYTTGTKDCRDMYARDISTTITSTDADAVVLKSGVSFAVPADAWITINNATTKYSTLADAVAAATDNATLTVTGQMIVESAAVIVGKTLTLQGANTSASITASGNFAVMVLHNANVTVSTLKLNGNSSTKSGVVTFGDYDYGQSENNVAVSGQVAYTGATLTLNSGAVITNSYSSSGANTGGNGVSALLKGDSKVIVNTGAGMTTGGTAFRADADGTMKVTIAGGTVTSSGRGMVVNSDNSSLTITSGSFSTTNASAWLIHCYGKAFSLTVDGGTLSTGGGDILTCNSGNNNGGKVAVALNGGTVKKGTAVVYDSTFEATFTDKNMMYLYVDSGKTTAGSGLGFASQINVNANASLQMGFLMAPTDKMLEGDELLLGESDNMELNVTVSALNSNGFMKAAVTGLTKNMMDCAIAGRAYATVTINLSTNVKVTKTVYGEMMSATARDFARAYVRDNQNIDAATQTVVNYFMANGNV